MFVLHSWRKSKDFPSETKESWNPKYGAARRNTSRMTSFLSGLRIAPLLFVLLAPRAFSAPGPFGRSRTNLNCIQPEVDEVQP